MLWKVIHLQKMEFFERIRRNCSTECEYLIELIKMRGFFVEVTDDGLCLSDNAHSDDIKYLDMLLLKTGCGSVQGDMIILNPQSDTAAFERVFDDRPIYGSESVSNDYGWNFFRQRKHGRKIQVGYLDPFIARYIKAISACCVFTAGSCDGNHPNRRKMIVDIEGEASTVWHQLICRAYLIGRYKIDWSEDYCKIIFDRETKYRTYYEVNRAATFLYEHRQAIREIKQRAFDGMTASYFRHHSNHEIKGAFIERAERLLFEGSSCCNSRN